MHFTAKNKVRMHDTDMAGILYFARQFRFAHDTLEEFVESEGFNFYKLFTEGKFAFVIAHCEADYFASLRLGDHLEIHLTVERIGNTSFTLLYKIYRESVLVGRCKTVHVCVAIPAHTKIPIPESLKHSLEKYFEIYS